MVKTMQWIIDNENDEDDTIRDTINMTVIDAGSPYPFPPFPDFLDLMPLPGPPILHDK